MLDTLQTQLCEDTVFTVVETPVVSLFQDHQQQAENGFSYMERVVSGGSFGFFILFICAAIVVYLQRNSDGIFSAVMKASFDINQASQDARVENSQRSRNMLIIQMVSAISMIGLAMVLPVIITFCILGRFCRALITGAVSKYLYLNIYPISSNTSIS